MAIDLEKEYRLIFWVAAEPLEYRTELEFICTNIPLVESRVMWSVDIDRRQCARVISTRIGTPAIMNIYTSIKCTMNNFDLLSGFVQTRQWHISLNHRLVDRIEWCPIGETADYHTPECVPLVHRWIHAVCQKEARGNFAHQLYQNIDSWEQRHDRCITWKILCVHRCWHGRILIAGRPVCMCPAQLPQRPIWTWQSPARHLCAPPPLCHPATPRPIERHRGPSSNTK